MRSLLRWITLTGGLLTAACVERLPTPPEMHPALPASTPLLFVLNTLSRDVSVLDLERDTLVHSFLRAGRWTNRVHATSAYLWVVNSGDNTVLWMDRTRGTLDTLTVGPGRNPWDARWSSTLRRLFVTHWLRHTLSALDPLRDTVLWEVPVCTNPEGLAVVYTQVIVACTDYLHGYARSGLRVVDGRTGQVLDSLDVGVNVQEVAVDAEGDVYALSTGDYATIPGKLYRLRLNPLRVLDSVVLEGYPGSLDLNAEGILVVAGFQGGVYRYDVAAETLRTHLPLPDVADAVEWQGRLYLARFSLDRVEIRDTLGQLEGTYPVGDGPLDLELLSP